MHFDPMLQLSAHFQAWEIVGRTPTPTPSALELLLAAALCQGPLEMLREVAGGPLRITPGGGGRRTLTEHHALAKNGKKPSTTTDHTFGPGFVDVVGAYRQVEGGRPFFGTGAADVMPVSEVGEVRKWTMAEFQAARARVIAVEWGFHEQGRLDYEFVRQMIYYPDRGHIHVANPLRAVHEAITALVHPKVSRFYVSRDQNPVEGAS